MDCPACGAPMDVQTLDAMYGRTVTIDVCHACTGIWFDTLESLRLTPGAVLRLFKLIHDRRGEGPPAAGVTRCPRCKAPLAETTDMQGTTRFHYLRCPAEHGRFITFFQFLREENFVRPLSPPEIAQLRKNHSRRALLGLRRARRPRALGDMRLLPSAGLDARSRPAPARRPHAAGGGDAAHDHRSAVAGVADDRPARLRARAAGRTNTVM